MAEKVVSPGVFTNEIDASFLPAAIGDIGAALVGPTVKGPFFVPTVVTSYSEFEAKFGSTFESGSGVGKNEYRLLTDYTAEQYLKNGPRLTVVRVPDHATTYGPAESFIHFSSSTNVDALDMNSVANTTTANASFGLKTLSEGVDQNSTGSQGANGLLVSMSSAAGGAGGAGGTKNNLRWEISSVNYNKGTFTLLIRRGDDIHKRKQILETWNNLSLDPNQPNYVSKVIGDQNFTKGTDADGTVFLQLSGSYANKSKYVRVVNPKDTTDYLDENGNIRDTGLRANLPHIQTTGNSVSGSFKAGQGYNTQFPGTHAKFNENIDNTNSQGLPMASVDDIYVEILSLLSNADEYDFNLLLLPGVISNLANHAKVATKAIDICESRGDAFYIMDPVAYGSALTSVTTEVEKKDSNYAGAYWPWIQIPDSKLAKSVWVPPSVVMGGIYAFNDKVAHPWFAPAGLNRGGIDVAIQAERKLTHSNRDTLYESNVNPIATFPGQGVCVWGQKTMQKKASALDRVNVRRLLIKVKKFIAASSKFLLFEQNNSALRKRFLNIANPYLEQVQANSGLSAFRVVMDESNNPPDLVDRNILYGQIFLQPTRTAEFIILDFTIQPTGATFPE